MLVTLITIFGSVYAVPVSQDTQTSNTASSNDESSSSPVNGLLAAIGMLPGIGEEITAISGALTTFEASFATALNVQTTQNAAAGCKDMTVIFARGNTETGNVGLVTGPPFFDALSSIIGANSMTVQGVDYSASIERFLQGRDVTGSQTM